MRTHPSIADLSFEFALKIVYLFNVLQKNKEFVLSKQLLRSGTSIGANVEEASAAQTKKDFICKMAIASKEARETRYWLKLLSRSKLADLDYSSYLRDIEDIIRMLTKIVKTSQQNMLKDQHQKPNPGFAPQIQQSKQSIHHPPLNT